MVGPFIFLDHIGPAEFVPGTGIDVRPHPHIGLATVTYLFEGSLDHRDSLGCVQTIEPGAVNWMTAGRGIVHSERTGPLPRARGHRIHGIQSWVALPRSHEDIAPGFRHHPAETLPEFSLGGARLRIIAASGERPAGLETTVGNGMQLTAKPDGGSWWSDLACAVQPVLSEDRRYITLKVNTLRPAGEKSVSTGIRLTIPTGKGIVVRGLGEGAALLVQAGTAP